MSAPYPPPVRPNFPAWLYDQYGADAQFALDVAERIWAATKDGALDALARRSPALAGFDWRVYLRMSAIRVLRTHRALASAGIASGRVLDFGAYFCNFSLYLAAKGYAVDALDAFAEYAPALGALRPMLEVAGVRQLDFADLDADLTDLGTGAYDAVILMGVVEHIPHTPRPVLEAVDRCLRPGGVLVLDTPNLAYEYNRVRFAAGESIHYPLQRQYWTEVPFEGHHREYTTAEVLWMLEQLGHEVLACDHFNYSIHALAELTGVDAARYHAMEADPLRREIIMTVSRKRHPEVER
jgi:2-polyprenyl-3-methyl-5-hydroxy-6-metoxy-1,4-benzoquinol methylase